MSYAFPVTAPISLIDIDPQFDAGLKRAEGEAHFQQLMDELVELQERLYAAGQHSLLIVLQGRDTSGKDGAIGAITGPLNSVGCRVASFKVPTEEERAHDFLWRVHKQVPARGEIVVFNRSHYEDVLVARVHNLVPQAAWQARFDQINAFEQSLAAANTIVLKFYLHISKEEQEERLLKREASPEKFWKLSVGDWQERERWDDYTAAYEEALNRCRAAHAPWFVVPANKKWFRNLAVAEAVVAALKPFVASWLDHLNEIGKAEKAKIDEFRKAH